ncbi:dihydroorotate dehydrogenase [Streptomyces sp. 205]|uniref:dihydrouracil dehydrogenase (NAD(+)) n=1 Tax=Streptomyces coffeae TaxID=621382 RepID=A0ABS1NGI5_9ACTN|nr:dihydroorotate dehydrogenase [Streptomyces coffeae]
MLGLRLASPVVVGSGLLTDQERNIRRLLEDGAGAVVTKTIHPDPSTPGGERLLRLPTGMLNSTTYSRRPVDDWCAMLCRFADEKLPVIASLYADSPAELADLAARVTATGTPALELGISCLNEEGGLDDTPERVAAYTAAVRRRTPVPFSVKLASGERVRERVDAAVASGANAITLSDTLPGLAVDADTGEVLLGGVFGYSGPGIKPLVLAEIFGLRRTGLTVPLMASGGVENATDVAEYLSVGADVVQVYTALHRNMHTTLRTIREDFDGWLGSKGGEVVDVMGRSIKRS